MMSQQREQPFDPVVLRRMISAWCDGAINDGDLSTLKQTLANDAAARSIFLACMEIQAGMRAEAAAIEFLNEVTPASCPFPLRPLHRVGGGKVLAAALVFVAIGWGAVMVLHRFEPTAPGARGVGSDGDHGAASVRLAHIRDVSANCEWSLDHNTDVNRRRIYSGDMIRVASGMMKLAYDNGTVVTLHGPALFEAVSEMHGRVLLGKLTAKIAKGAEGFTVLTPRATVVDLGTELGIEVDRAGATDVVVFEGLVDLAYTSHRDGPETQRSLSAGEAVHLDAFGTVSRIVSITQQRFADRPLSEAAASRPPVITAVRDNIQREQAWNYYEIVHSGMQEDAKAFVDRQSHEWNGLDAAGLPRYLIGGDYVKMFNNDKCLTDIEIVLSLSRPCRLYVLFDDRIAPPQWLRERFTPTGDKVGLDNGPWVYNGVPSQGVFSAKGAGNSVDDSMSVWVRDIAKHGPISLGATETTHDDLNMYGIVAVPLEGDDATEEEPAASDVQRRDSTGDRS